MFDLSRKGKPSRGPPLQAFLGFETPNTPALAFLSLGSAMDLHRRRKCAEPDCENCFIPKSVRHRFCLKHRKRTRGIRRSMRCGMAGRIGGCGLRRRRGSVAARFVVRGVATRLVLASRGIWGMLMVAGRGTFRGRSTLDVIAGRTTGGGAGSGERATDRRRLVVRRCRWCSRGASRRRAQRRSCEPARSAPYAR